MYYAIPTKSADCSDRVDFMSCPDGTYGISIHTDIDTGWIDVNKDQLRALRDVINEGLGEE